MGDNMFSLPSGPPELSCPTLSKCQDDVQDMKINDGDALDGQALTSGIGQKLLWQIFVTWTEVTCGTYCAGTHHGGPACCMSDIAKPRPMPNLEHAKTNSCHGSVFDGLLLLHNNC
jgi:hypothetical protein